MSVLQSTIKTSNNFVYKLSKKLKRGGFLESTLSTKLQKDHWGGPFKIETYILERWVGSMIPINAF